MEEILNLLFDFKINQNYSSLKYLVLFVISIQSRKEKKNPKTIKNKNLSVVLFVVHFTHPWPGRLKVPLSHFFKIISWRIINS